MFQLLQLVRADGTQDKAARRTQPLGALRMSDWGRRERTWAGRTLWHSPEAGQNQSCVLGNPRSPLYPEERRSLTSQDKGTQDAEGIGRAVFLSFPHSVLSSSTFPDFILFTNVNIKPLKFNHFFGSTSRYEGSCLYHIKFILNTFLSFSPVNLASPYWPGTLGGEGKAFSSPKVPNNPQGNMTPNVVIIIPATYYRNCIQNNILISCSSSYEASDFTVLSSES